MGWSIIDSAKYHGNRKCHHLNTIFTEVVTSSIQSEYNPIKNSRIKSINDFKTTKVKNIKVPATKCLDCGEITYNVRDTINNDEIAQNSNGMVNKDFDQQMLKIKKMLDENRTINKNDQKINALKRQLEDAREELNKLKKRAPEKYSAFSMQKIMNTQYQDVSGRSTSKLDITREFKRDLTVFDAVTTIFRNSSFKLKTIDDKEYYDIIFYSPIKTTDPKLIMFEDGGEVMEWTNFKKEGLRGLLSKSERRIKTMRIEKILLDKWFETKYKKNEN